MRFVANVFIFWFFDAPRGLIAYFASLNNAFLKMFSFQVLLRTYFKPWKNEYRKGLVGFSIFMGIFFKTFLILFDVVCLSGLVVLETALTILFIVWPFLTVGLLFIK